MAGIAPGAVTESLAGSVLSIQSGGGTLTVNLSGTGGQQPSLLIGSDGQGGTTISLDAIVPGQTSFVVSSEAELNADLAKIDAGGGNATANTAYTITLNVGALLALTSDLDAIDLDSGSSLTIIGNGGTIDGGYSASVAGSGYRGLFVYAGSVTVQNLTIQNTVARGGAGGSGALGGGGGMGAGGGLFIASAGTVTLAGVSFSNDAAIGGAGGAGGETGAGGGGGLGAPEETASVSNAS